MSPGSPTPPRIRTGRALILTGSALIALAVLLVVGGMVVGFRSFGDGVADLQRVGPAGGTVTLPAGRSWVYAEYPGADATSRTFAVTFDDQGDETAAPIPIRSSSSTTTYSWGGHSGRSIGRVDVPTAGTYRLVPGDGPRPADGFAVGQDALGGGFVKIGIGVVLGIVVGGLGIVLLAVGIAKRSRARRAFWSAGAGWDPVVPPPGPLG
jgi:hypothetical protein